MHILCIGGPLDNTYVDWPADPSSSYPRRGLPQANFPYNVGYWATPLGSDNTMHTSQMHWVNYRLIPIVRKGRYYGAADYFVGVPSSLSEQEYRALLLEREVIDA